MNQLAEQVERFGFRAKRLSYGITLDDISKKCGLAISTISAYERFSSKYTETRTRDENAITIDRALNDIINEKIQETFTNAVTSQKEEKVVEKSDKSLHPFLKNAFDRKYVTDKIRDYCTKNGITLSEFTKMCDIAANTFCDCTIKSNPYLYPSTVGKIVKATGWDISFFKKEGEEPVMQPVQSTDIEDLEDPKVIIKDRKFIFEDGRYYEMHTEVITKTVLKEINKDEFLAAIG